MLFQSSSTRKEKQSGKKGDAKIDSKFQRLRLLKISTSRREIAMASDYVSRSLLAASIKYTPFKPGGASSAFPESTSPQLFSWSDA